MNQPFDDLSQTWMPRAKNLLSSAADDFSDRIKSRFTTLVTDSVFLLAAFFSMGAVAAWLSVAVWESLIETGLSRAYASLSVAVISAAIVALLYGLGRWRSQRFVVPLQETLPVETEDSVGTFFKDLAIATKEALDPTEILKPHAVKVTLATTAIGFFVAYNLSSRKD